MRKIRITVDGDGYVIRIEGGVGPDEPIDNVTIFDRAAPLVATLEAGGELLRDSFGRLRWKLAGDDAVEDLPALTDEQKVREEKRRVRAAYSAEQELELLLKAIENGVADPDFAAYKIARDKIASDVSKL